LPRNKECPRRIIDLIRTLLLLLHPPSNAELNIQLLTITMNKRDVNTRLGVLHLYSEKESLPLALDEHFFNPKDKNDNKFRETSDGISKLKPTQPSIQDIEITSKFCQSPAITCSKSHSINPSFQQHLLHSTPPDLAESTTTDGTSCCSAFSASNSDITKSINQRMQTSSSSSLPYPAFFLSSIISASSLTSVPLEPRPPDTEFYPVDYGNSKRTSQSFHDPPTIPQQPENNSSSIGFSELLEASNDSNIELERSRLATRLSDHKSSGKLPPLLENQEVESGTLISAVPVHETIYVTPKISRLGAKKKWWHNVPLFDSGSQIVNQEFERPLLNTFVGTNSSNDVSGNLPVTRLLSGDSIQNQYVNLALKRASESVQTQIEGEDSFEVSLLLEANTNCTVDDVMEVISDTDLLNLWCSPIEAMIVTSSSNENSSYAMSLDKTRINDECGLDGSSNNRDDNYKLREYEAEWIEATTSSLESPSSGVSFILSAGQSALQSLGCASYGRITMFIERRHGRIGLTIGPFHGGIHASHSISVSPEDPSSNGGRIRIVDRVRLTRDDEVEEFFSGEIFGCAMGSCLSHFFFPSIIGYVDQVTMSMARLRILLENKGGARSRNRLSC